MNSVFSAVLTTLLILVVLWILIFGTAGWLLAKKQNFSLSGGFLLGVFTGPFGLCFILWKGRHTRFSHELNSLPSSQVAPDSSSYDDVSSI